jgi:hypothetical protein
MKTLNIFQAAFQLRMQFADKGIELDYVGCSYTNTYFIHHDAVHYYTNLTPAECDEPLVLATELALGGQDYASTITVNSDELSAVLSKIPSDVIEELISFYTEWYANNEAFV